MVNNSPQNNPITKRQFDSSIKSLAIDVDVLKIDGRVLKKDVAILKDDVKVLKCDVKILKDDVKILKQDVSVLKKSVLNIENKINVYSDMYEINKWNADKLANRVSVLEKHNGINPPQDFLISGI